jgi:hypothetical protein
VGFAPEFLNSRIKLDNPLNNFAEGKLVDVIDERINQKASPFQLMGPAPQT